MPPSLIREATAADVPAILERIQALAAFERAPDAVEATAEDLLREGFGERPAFHCLLALLDGRPAGFALWFHNFSTWTGRKGIHLEDLYVHEWARGQGLAVALMRRLAAIAVATGCARLDLQVLHWNPARRFYERLGMTERTEWLPWRLEDAALIRLATGDAPSAGPSDNS
jgi:GNAT superfamily N-acetyltransferase